IAAVLALPQVDTEAVRKAGFTVVLDAINSVGNIIMPKLLQLMGVRCIKINGEPNGNFAHNPEPLPKNLIGLSKAVKKYKADLGISVDPDVDRLAFICENGEPFVEEYTLVGVADYILSLAEAQGLKDLCTVSNLSSSRALRDVTEAHGGTYYASAVGEVNVTTKMHQVGALIGGEGNGGVIFPALHSGRDAMVGTALFLSNLAHKKMTASQYKATLPQYVISKNRIDLDRPELVDVILEEIKKKFADEKINTVDGVRIDFESKKQWVHLRKSNTEPIIRVYAEAQTEEQADALAGQIVSIAKDILNV
ncbi:MAG: phosphoglucosamine mutase, partial [Bacteroidales bacterium]|nr:phosphoglucosamine mutase [Bacteroidales bacterium]